VNNYAWKKSPANVGENPNWELREPGCVKTEIWKKESVVGKKIGGGHVRLGGLETPHNTTTQEVEGPSEKIKKARQKKTPRKKNQRIQKTGNTVAKAAKGKTSKNSQREDI